jgi:hypothetical protein
MAYCVGHTSALQLARKARDQTSDEAKMKMLRTAYIHEAFAAHFLTDLFSSGHLRAPRRAFHNPNYLTMGLDGWLNNPVWDFQCRFVCTSPLFLDKADWYRCTTMTARPASWFAMSEETSGLNMAS